MVYLYGTLALILSLFELIFFRIAIKGKSAYHNVAAAIAIFAAPFTGYYIVAFMAELVRLIKNPGSWSP